VLVKYLDLRLLIVSIEVDDSGESEGIANPVFERLPQDIINGQTLNASDH
jgi:hypothetical protein